MHLARQHFDPDAIARFGDKLAAWAETLDPTSQAMLVDLLARAGADARGAPREPAASREGDDPTSDELSPLENRDFATAARAILEAGDVTDAERG